MTLLMGYEIETNGLTKRGISQITRICNRGGAVEIQEQLPLHFEQNAQQRFRYRRRSKRYEERKRRLFGHTRPLVFRGHLRRAVLSSARVTATQNQGKVTARGSRQSNLTRQHRAEIESLTGEQEQRIARNYRDTFVRLASLPRYQKKAAL